MDDQTRQHSCRHASHLGRTAKRHSSEDTTKITRVTFFHLDQLLMRKSVGEETERSKFDSLFIQGIWLGRATESDEHIVGTADGVYTARSIRAKNDQEIWNGDLIKRMRGTPWDPRADESRAEFRVPEERHRPLIQMEHEHKESQTVLGRYGQDCRMCGMCKPKGKQTQCCLFESTG